MPSPFPGMDPYLEDTAHFRSFHHGFISAICAALNRTLPPRYAAKSDERLVVAEQGGDRWPDVTVSRRPSGSRDAPAAAAAVADPALYVRSALQERHEAFINIIIPRPYRRLVATIEVLSPTNKAAGSRNRDAYLAKQTELLASDSHFLEIDLLRGGAHTVAASAESPPRPSGWHGVVCLHRSGTDGFELWPVAMQNRLPRIPVPLVDGDADVVLELQSAFDRCFEEAGFARDVDYDGPPPGAFSAGELQWIEAALAERGLRPGVGPAGET
jgi:hypothetical protein